MITVARTAGPGEPLPPVGCTTDHHGSPCDCRVLDTTPTAPLTLAQIEQAIELSEQLRDVLKRPPASPDTTGEATDG